jgi:hypothetical protein
MDYGTGKYMITFSELGRMGLFANQMFQLATLIGVSEKTGHELKLPRENTNHEFGQFYNLATGKTKHIYMEMQECFEVPDKYFAPRAEVMGNIQQQYKEPFFNFDKNIFDIPDGTDINGFFQSDKYFRDAESTVRSVFTFKPEIQERAKRELDKIRQDVPLVSIHVRRGDYVFNSGNHTVVDLDFYSDVIGKFFSDQPYQFVVFSDDVEWCKNAFEGGYVIDINDARTEMCMMSMCDHHIIGNSTFSWWGAWLNPNPQKIVVAPSQWFGPNIAGKNNIMDVLPQTWFFL